MSKKINRLLKDIDKLVLNAVSRNKEISGEISFIRQEDVKIDLDFARSLELRANRIGGELVAYEKIQLLCAKMLEEEENDEYEI